MKYLTQHWTKNDDGILFFFQRLEEMLFHYSDDIVRVPVNNTHTLISEYLTNEVAMKKGEVKQYQLDQILDELSYSIQTDKILCENLGEEFIITVADHVKKTKGDGIRYLYGKISGQTYYKWCIEFIKKHVIQHNHKNEIEFGLRAWVSEIINYGYSHEYIYKYLHDILLSNANEPVDIIYDFLEHFNLKKNEYQVYLTFTPSVYQYKDLFANRMQVSFEDDGHFCEIKKRKNDFIGYVKVSSLDRNQAARHAYSIITTFTKFYRVVSNRRKQLVRISAVVRKEDEDNVYTVPVKAQGYRAIEVEPQLNLKHIIDAIIMECQNKSIAIQ